MVDKVMKVLRDKHGNDLTFNDGESYYLFLEDGLYNVYLDEDKNTLKVNVQFLTVGKTFIYESSDTLKNLML